MEDHARLRADLPDQFDDGCNVGTDPLFAAIAGRLRADGLGDGRSSHRLGIALIRSTDLQPSRVVKRSALVASENYSLELVTVHSDGEGRKALAAVE